MRHRLRIPVATLMVILIFRRILRLSCEFTCRAIILLDRLSKHDDTLKIRNRYESEGIHNLGNLGKRLVEPPFSVHVLPILLLLCLVHCSARRTIPIIINQFALQNKQIHQAQNVLDMLHKAMYEWTVSFLLPWSCQIRRIPSGPSCLHHHLRRHLHLSLPWPP
jgi:hypothetical protein